jgi:2-polyprenyl-6-methoxyphenol hydroxylase-like FAD-dependent oxidoreductase
MPAVCAEQPPQALIWIIDKERAPARACPKAFAMREVDVPVLIIGGGPVGLALAVDLGWRGISACVIEQEDGTIDHPRANAENARTMEFFRRWGIADAVRTSGTPQDFTQAVVYATSLGGYEIARIDRPGHGGSGGTAISPERPQRCNQLWLDPILRERATSFSSIDLRLRTRFESFVQDADGVDAVVRDLATGEQTCLRAQYLIACCGGRSGVAKSLGIESQGSPAIEYNLNVFVRIENLWSHTSVAEAAMYFLVAPEGIWRTLIDIDGRGLWRLGLRGKAYYDDPAGLDLAAMLREVIGVEVPFEEISRRGWVARDLVADRYGSGRVFLAGDAAHQNTPSGGFGMNTGIGDAVDLGWKLAAAVAGWGGPELLATYETERRPVALRNVRQATDNFVRDRQRAIDPAIATAGAEGDRARAALRARLVASQSRQFLTDGTALGYRYDGSPICIPDGSAALPDTIVEYRPNALPGARAPHAVLADGRSILDLYGHGFVLLAFDADAADVDRVVGAFRAAGVPLTVHPLAGRAIAALYERRLVLVRPDGHVAWRGDAAPADAAALADTVRGARAANVERTG